ncbi:MAG: hypothetical protein QOF53_2547 [Nocardioidaceae bacterium]|nr:hypothetical protein [Nocardioidaceae bacterium]
MSLIVPILLLGLLASLSPTTIVVFILLLGTARARVNALAFLVGWAVSLTVVFAASFSAGASHPLQGTSGRTSVQLAQVLLGVALVAVGIRQWRRRHVARPAAAAVDRHARRLNPWSAAFVGVLKQPWAITAAAALVVLDHHTGLVAAAIAFVLFTAASTASVALLFLYYARQPGEAEARLTALRLRLTAAGPALFAGVAVLVGAIVALDGLHRLLGG